MNTPTIIFTARRASIKEFACKKKPSLDFCSDVKKPFLPIPPKIPQTRISPGSNRRITGTRGGNRRTESISESLGLGGPSSRSGSGGVR